MKDITEFYTDPQVQSTAPGMIPIVHNYKTCQTQCDVGASRSLGFDGQPTT
jgi:hypothetical protein